MVICRRHCLMLPIVLFKMRCTRLTAPNHSSRAQPGLWISLPKGICTLYSVAIVFKVIVCLPLPVSSSSVHHLIQLTSILSILKLDKPFPQRLVSRMSPPSLQDLTPSPYFRTYPYSPPQPPASSSSPPPSTPSTPTSPPSAAPYTAYSPPY